MIDQENKRNITCCFTGHRPDKLPSGWRQERDACAPLRAALRSSIKMAVENGYRCFISGMAQGVDTLAAEEVLLLRDKMSDIKLIAALPCPNQDYRWPAEARIKFKSILDKADKTKIVCDFYSPFCMGARNLWMVEQSSMLIAVYDGSKGGTANTISHAERFGLKIIKIDPNNLGD